MKPLEDPLSHAQAIKDATEAIQQLGTRKPPDLGVTRAQYNEIVVRSERQQSLQIRLIQLVSTLLKPHRESMAVVGTTIEELQRIMDWQQNSSESKLWTWFMPLRSHKGLLLKMSFRS